MSDRGGDGPEAGAVEPGDGIIQPRDDGQLHFLPGTEDYAFPVTAPENALLLRSLRLIASSFPSTSEATSSMKRRQAGTGRFQPAPSFSPGQMPWT